MGEQVVGRRRVLRGAGLAAGGVAISGLGLKSTAMADGGHGGHLDGSWMIVRQDDGDPVEVTAVLSFADGDVFISHDISPAGPPFTGTWAAHGKSFRATFWTGFPGDEGPGSPGPTIRVQLSGRVRHGTMTGTYTVSVFFPLGEEVDTITGVLTGSRIEA